MKTLRNTVMNWWARPFPHVNAVVLSIFAGFLFLGGVAVAFRPELTEGLEVLQAPKLRIAVRLMSFLFFSCYCTLGCLCRILIQFFPEDFDNEQGHI